MSIRALVTDAGLLSLGLTFVLSLACGGDDGPGPMNDEELSESPLCADVQGTGPRELLSEAVVDTDTVLHSLVFGGMDPGSLAPFNFELGFLLNDINVDVRAPADLYLRTVQYQTYTRGSRAGETDFGMNFDICSDGDQRTVVEGDLAHLTTIEPVLQELLDNAELECQDKTGPEEDATDCTAYLQGEGIVIEAGTLLGSAGGTGQTDYRPGLDFNLLDSRYANDYVNPDRLGAEDGPARAFRYGACVYEYFPPALRDAYIALIGQNGVFRDSQSDPCGTMSIDEANTAAGIWIRKDKASLDINENLFDVLGNILVLAPHPIEPEIKQVISTELTDFNEFNGNPRLMAFEPTDVGDANVSFYDMTPGTLYCIQAEPLGDEGIVSFYVQLGDDGSSLMFERSAEDCGEIKQSSWALTSAAVEFVR